MMYLGAEFKPEKDLVKNLMQVNTAGTENSKSGFEELPKIENMNTPVVLSKLNSVLVSQPFLGGQSASSTDCTAWNAITSTPCYFTQSGLTRWWHRMNAMTDEERKALPKGKGLSLPSPAPLGP